MIRWCLLTAVPLTALARFSATEVLIVLLTIFLVGGIALWQRLLCPRCGEAFCGRSYAFDPWAKRCVSCALPFGTRKRDAPPQRS